ncbi:MAG: energy-coupling factor transporter transmembrane protein EcfT [Firmicutes bacterium]|jgi:energy-coupling factor transport system permease protein|nr:energy-coupling factor transporter transmembrane protein EcfT [Bacillota bacterium]MBQ2271066.1 energy-coupling factor transporter transmembrane protein EcfT [Bacillota bacterium]MBQ5797575.1 energy-coupling factor transporter transmembrane protein EcfT [Bacillota bacterium]
MSSTRRDGGAFAGYHPLVNFLYFVLVLLGAMIFMHPLALTISLAGAFTYSVVLSGKKALKFNIKYCIPMMLITALVNPAFNHEGMTILTYLRNGNPLTLESVIYGIAAAAMIVTVIIWFSCYNAVMTSDKFVYLFGRIIPSLSLILSMVLRFVPRFKEQIRVISNAQKCVGRDVSNGGLLDRAKHGLKILSIMITWALENAIETADSMKSRGYGLPGRTAFSIFRFDKRDRKALLAIALTGGLTYGGAFAGTMYWRYFPSMKGVDIGFISILTFLAYGALCMVPVAIQLWEERTWKRLQSNI